MDFTGERFIPLPSLLEDEIGFEHLHRYHAVKKIVEGKTVLDIACGEGYGTAILARNAKKVIGVDIDEESIIHARKQYSPVASNLEFITGDAISIPLEDDSVDVVISFETIEHINEKTQQNFIIEVRRVLRKGGCLVISTPDIANYSERYDHKNEFHEKEFDKKEFTDFLGHYFTGVTLFTQGYEIISAITQEQPQEVKAVEVYDWERSSKKAFSRKYLVAVCCDEKEKLDISSIVFQVSADYLEVTDRIVEKEKHILELGAWGKSLDKEIAEKNEYIRKLQGEAEEFRTAIQQGLKDGELKEAFSVMQLSLEKQLGEISKRLIHQEEYEKNILTLQAKLSHNEDELKEAKLSLALELNKLKDLEERLEHSDARLKEAEGTKSLLIALEEDMRILNEKFSSAETQTVSLKDLASSQTIQLNQKTDQLERERKNVTDQKILLQQQDEKLNSLTRSLQAAEGRLNEIYQSEGWKLLKRYYNFKGRVLPEDSKRYLFLKKTFNKIRGKKENLDPWSEARTEQLLQHTAPLEINATTQSYDIIEFTHFQTPVVSIVIPVYNAWDITYRCLQSINNTVSGVPYEVIIGDDASTDDVKNIHDYIKNIVVVRNEKNVGFLNNCNTAAETARGKYIVFLNNDTSVNPGWLNSLVELMEADESIGMAGSKLIYPDGRLQEAGGIVWDDASAWNFGHSQDPGHPQFNYVKEVDYISGASIMIRSTLWKKLGGFDTRFVPAYCEDSDLAFSVRSLGYKVVYQPLSEVIHYEGHSHGEQSKEYQRVNNKKFFEKWKDVLQEQQFKNGEEVFWARDRSRNKKTILVVDHYVPHYDKDAGSRTVFQYLKLFVALGYNVKFIGDNFYRHEPYTTTLQQMGIEVLYGNWFSENWKQWVESNSDKIDYILLNRPHISIKYIEFMREHTKAILLYYGHDLHFVRELRQYELEKKPELLKSSAMWKETETFIFNKSDVILTPGEDEKRVIDALGVAGETFSIRPYIYYEKAHPINDFSNRRDILFVGGFTHKPNVDAVLWFLAEVWPLIKAGCKESQFVIVGSNTPPAILEMASLDVRVFGFLSDQDLQKIYMSSRIVVVPLRYGAGVKGKTVEAMYNGLPLVSTSFGIEGMPEQIDFIQAKSSAEEFAAEAIRIYNLPDDKLVALSKMESDYINRNFHVGVVSTMMQNILSEARLK